MRTLVLDRGYQPHRVVTWQKAVTLMFGGKVEVVEQYDEVIRSPSIAVPMPAVVRLMRVVRRRHELVRFSRRNVLVRDGFTCQYCGDVLPEPLLTMDHVLPRSRGGRTSWDNVVAACRACNGRKGSRTPMESHMRLRRDPFRPSRLPARAFRVGDDVPETWRDWLRWAGVLAS